MTTCQFGAKRQSARQAEYRFFSDSLVFSDTCFGRYHLFHTLLDDAKCAAACSIFIRTARSITFDTSSMSIETTSSSNISKYLSWTASTMETIQCAICQSATANKCWICYSNSINLITLISPGRKEK